MEASAENTAVKATPLSSFSAETAENHPDVEKAWAVKALDHAEVYFKLLSSLPSDYLPHLKLTKLDDELYARFRTHFPTLDVVTLQEVEEFKTPQAKELWRAFIAEFEGRLTDFNFGTLLRVNAKGPYDHDNAFFVTRAQFYAIEIARNREGANALVSTLP